MLAAVLLAAGAGRRLGLSKARLDLGGTSALQRCVDALRAGGAEPVIVVADGPLSATGARIVLNEHHERGQTSSLKAGLASLPPVEAFLLHTVDHPLVSAADVLSIVAAWKARPPSARIVAPSVAGRRGHPAVFDAALLPEFLALSDEQPAHLVLRRDPGRVHHALMENEWIVRDIDTPEDLAAARAALGH